MAKWVPPEGPYSWLSIELCRCGFYKASNRGRCAVCLDYYNDVQLSELLDWLVVTMQYPPNRFALEAGKLLERHGSMIAV